MRHIDISNFRYTDTSNFRYIDTSNVLCPPPPGITVFLKPTLNESFGVLSGIEYRTAVMVSIPFIFCRYCCCVEYNTCSLSQPKFHTSAYMYTRIVIFCLVALAVWTTCICGFPVTAVTCLGSCTGTTSSLKSKAVIRGAPQCSAFLSRFYCRRHYCCKH